MRKKDRYIHVGTSGWSYDHWKGPFYPKALPADQMLEYYAQHFRSMEINNSFYRLPEKKTLQHWYECTPDDFLFTAKDDMNPVGTEMKREDWDAPYQEVDEKRRAGPREPDETQEETEDDWGEGQPEEEPWESRK